MAAVYNKNGIPVCCDGLPLTPGPKYCVCGVCGKRYETEEIKRAMMAKKQMKQMKHQYN